MFITQKYKIMIRMLIGVFILIGLTSLWVINTAAQFDEDSWSEPINLSNSGSTTDPQLVVDANGTFHALWIDEFDGYVYAQSTDGVQWSTPVALSFPFSVEDSLSLLLADARGYVHAFWTDEEGTLYYSRVLGVEFGNPASWLGAIGLAESALDLDATVDSAGSLHLAYVRPLSTVLFPSGIYYRRSMDGGQSWSNGDLLYPSQYFRSLTSENAHVQISTTNVSGENHIYIAWDNRPINRIFFAKSNDGGFNWISPIVIDEPGVDNFAMTPFNIQVQPSGNDILAIWQSGQPGSSTCAQYYVWSRDQGSTWTDRQTMIDELYGCADSNYFLASDTMTYLWTSYQDQIYLLAWNGVEWSELQPQRDLDNFLNPITLNYVNFRCRQAQVIQENRMFVIGCDAGEGEDIWITDRSLGDQNEWYPPPSAWRGPESITTIEADLLSPVMVRDSSDHLHILWSQAEDAQFPAVGISIYYMRFDGENWSSPVSIFSSQAGKADQTSSATDSSDHIHMVWSGETHGEIMYSWANTSLAMSAAEWAAPLKIPSPQPAGSSPSIFIDRTGSIYVIYAIPINEGRGIYLVKSEDDGESWSDPRLVFDAAGAGWGKVGEPDLTKSSNGQLHVLFKQLAIEGTRELESLFYTYSSDDGATWNEPERLAQGIIYFSEILSTGTNSVHRVWQEGLEFGSAIQHEYSLNDGTDWQRSSSISSIEGGASAISLASAPSGQLFLNQIIEDAYGVQTLREFEWAESQWDLGETLQIKLQSDHPAQGILSSITSEGRLFSILLQKGENPDTGGVENILWMTGHQIPLIIEIGATEQPELSTPIPQIQTTTIVTSTSIPQVEITATPTIDLMSQIAGNGQTVLFSSPWIGVLLGGILGLIVLIILIVIHKSIKN